MEGEQIYFWNRSSQNLREIKTGIETWIPPRVVRKEEVVVNRLGLGHTLATHSYLMNSENHGIPPLCPTLITLC